MLFCIRINLLHIILSGALFVVCCLVVPFMFAMWSWRHLISSQPVHCSLFDEMKLRGTIWSLSHLMSDNMMLFYNTTNDLFSINSILIFLVSRLTSGLDFLVKPFYLVFILVNPVFICWHWHMPTSWSIFLIWPTVVMGFFFTKGGSLLSPTIVVLHDLQGFSFLFLDSPVHSYHLKVCCFSIIMACCWQWQLFGLHIDS